MGLYLQGYNPYNMVDVISVEKMCLSYFTVRASYSNYDYYEDNTISKCSFLKLADCYSYIKEDRKTVKELNEPRVYHLIVYYQYSSVDDTYYFIEYEVHKHHNGEFYLKRL